jgi:hypothetical protein
MYSVPYDDHFNERRFVPRSSKYGSTIFMYFMAGVLYGKFGC